MSDDVPFGSGPPDRDPEDRPDQPNRPGDGGQPGDSSGQQGFPGFAGFFGIPGMPGNLPEDLASKIPLFTELQKLLSWQGGPVNWDLARQMAISQIAAGFRPVSPADREQVAAALHLADLWLDPVTALPSGVTRTEAWTRIEWVERTLPVWSALCDPVASRVVGAMGDALPAEARRHAGPVIGILGRLGGLMFGTQVGQGLGSLAGEVLSSTDVGLPLGPAGTGALVPENVAAFGAGLGRPADEVRLYLALREAAHHRLFGHVGWLRQRLLDTVDAFARGIRVDTGAIERAMSQIDPTDPESMQRAVAGGMFEPETTPEQRAALTRLETLLALVEGWVDAVVHDAASERLPGAAALRETLRRRRATGGPAEQTFATLVGLELRPRRLREASRLWHALAEHRGTDQRDAIWQHPDMLPTSDDLDDPEGFAQRGDDFPPLEGL